MNGTKVRVMAQGAMLASLFGVLGVINIYTGSIFDILLAYVMVIALAYYTYLYDYRAGLSVLAVSFVVLFLVGELFFTFYVTFTLFMGIFYGYCLKHKKDKRFAKYGLMLISAIKNFLIFFLLGSLLGLDIYQEGREIYQEIVALVPIFKNFMTVEITFGLIWVILFMSESYIVRVYSNIIVSKMMKRK